MPLYNYDCSSCGIIFEEIVSVDYYKEPQEHDECGNLCNRTAEGQGVYAHGIGLKEHTRTGSLAKTEHKWMEGAIDATKRAIDGKSGVSPYANYQINHDEAVNKGLAKKVDPKTAKKRRKSAAKLTQSAAQNMSASDRKRAEDGHSIKDN
mgnify:CR=1 FL=1|tara:strand:- start:465 stop:914 length:450 start_codon:yes stop_codon:yes gene_type:complete